MEDPTHDEASRKLYERCSLCKGTGIGPGGATICFGCKSRGFVEIGLTMGQVIRLVEAERRRLGDPAAPASEPVEGRAS